MNGEKKLTNLEKRIIDCRDSDNDLGYTIKQMLFTPFPHRDPGEVNSWSKQVNNMIFNINPLIVNRGGTIENYGIPFGATSRVILVFIITEARTQKSREIIVGKSFSEFLRNLDYSITGGEKGTIKRVKEQLKRLLTCNCTWIYSDDKKEVYDKRINIATKATLWKGDYEGKENRFGIVALSEEFYEMIKNDSVPINYSIIKALKHSSLAMDIYFWLNYVNYYNKQKKILPYKNLHKQFAPDNTITNFKRDFNHCLLLLQSAGFNFNIIQSRDSIILLPVKVPTENKI